MTRPRKFSAGRLGLDMSPVTSTPRCSTPFSTTHRRRRRRSPGRSPPGLVAAPAHAELLRNAKRAAHTLKGSANILGIRGVAKLAHRLEDLLEICEVDAEMPSAQRAGALMAAADCLEQMVAAVAGEDAAPDNALAVIGMIDTARVNNAPPHCPPASAAGRRRHRSPGWPAARAEARAMTRVPTELLDNLVRMMGELAIKNGELEQELKSASTAFARAHRS